MNYTDVYVVSSPYYYLPISIMKNMQIESEKSQQNDI